MKNLLIRTLTGIVFAATIIFSLLISEFTYAILFILILLAGLHEFFNIFKNGQIVTNNTYSILVGAITFLIFFFIQSGLIPTTFYFCLIPLALLVFIYELYRKSKTPFENIATSLLGFAYIVLPFSLTSFLVFTDEHNYNPNLLIALFALIWIYDSGAYIFGVSFGKHRLFERISPKKSWEGAIGGTIVTLVASWAISFFLSDIELIHWLAIAIITVISATFGDLTESLFKRQFNIKDSGNILPGHGGVLDRFDSLLFSVPSVIVYIKLFV